VGSGPFRFDRWVPQQFISFVRRGDATLLDGLVVRIFKDKSAAIRELEGGGLDYLRKVREDAYDRLVDGAGRSGFRSPSREYFYLVWNTRRAPWDDAAVRRAMTGLIDRRAIARAFGGGETAVAEGPVPPDDARHDAGLTSPDFDSAGSAAGLTARGFRKSGEGRWQIDGSGGVAVELLVLSAQSLHRDIASVVADDLRNAGFETSVRELETTGLEQRVRSGDFDVALYVRPRQLPVELASCFGTGGSANRAGLSLPELDRLIADDDSFGEAYARIVELQPWTFLYYRPDSVVFNSRLSGLEANRRDPIAAIEQWWIPRAQQ
jgi:ABC-type transport system substrate-binding protein